VRADAVVGFEQGRSRSELLPDPEVELPGTVVGDRVGDVDADRADSGDVAKAGRSVARPRGDRFPSRDPYRNAALILPQEVTSALSSIPVEAGHPTPQAPIRTDGGLLSGAHGESE
jgi:hypothetical protein